MWLIITPECISKAMDNLCVVAVIGVLNVLQIWLHVPMENPAVAAAYYHSNEEEFRKLRGGTEVNTWEW